MVVHTWIHSSINPLSHMFAIAAPCCTMRLHQSASPQWRQFGAAVQRRQQEVRAIQGHEHEVLRKSLGWQQMSRANMKGIVSIVCSVTSPGIFYPFGYFILSLKATSMCRAHLILRINECPKLFLFS